MSVETVERYLLKKHRHGGRDYPAGAKIRLRKDQAAWLDALEVTAEDSPKKAAEDTPQAVKNMTRREA